MKKNKWFWIILFALAFALTQSTLFINYTANPSWLGFPKWLWAFIGIHAFFLIILYAFMQSFWKEK